MQSCDADAKGSEVAQYEVYLNSGKNLLLCDHHMQSSWPAMKETGGIVALRIDAVADTAYGILDFESEDVASAIDVMQDAMLDLRPKWQEPQYGQPEPVEPFDWRVGFREFDEWFQSGGSE